MSKRDLVSEIQQKNARHEANFLHGSIELFALEASLRGLGESDKTMLALHMMGMASCIEVAAREGLKRLIDFGEPYFSHAELFKDIRFDFALTRALSERKITFGDLVSHSLPISRVGQIGSHFEVVLGGDENVKFQDILAGVQEFAEPVHDEIYGGAQRGTAQRAAPPLLVDAPLLLKDIAQIFELRHLVAHEASFDLVSRSDVARYLGSARLFVTALYELVEQKINFGASRNGIGGSIQELQRAGAVYSTAIEVQTRLFGRIRDARPGEADVAQAVAGVETTFAAYLDAETNLRLRMHGMPPGNAIRNIEADVTAWLWRQRYDYLTHVEQEAYIFSPMPDSA